MTRLLPSTGGGRFYSAKSEKQFVALRLSVKNAEIIGNTVGATLIK